MQIPILVEPVADSGFRAKSGEPLPLSADGATADEAVGKLRASLDRQLQLGKRLLAIDIGSDNPWLAMAGIHDPNDPLIQQWKKEMAAYREEIEDDPNRP